MDFAAPSFIEQIADLLVDAHEIAVLERDLPLQKLIEAALMHVGLRLAAQTLDKPNHDGSLPAS